mgnify:CR=1 FL=1
MKRDRASIEINTTVVRCDGGEGLLGHPAVFLNLGTEEKVLCPYCRKCFAKFSSYSTIGKKIKGLPWASL